MGNDSLNLGSKISDTRKKLGLSQEALAEKANVSLSTIQRIEKGTVKPRLYTVKILAESLGLEPTALLNDVTTKDDLKLSLQSLKRMNLSALILVFIPLVNLLVPSVIWKMDKQIQSKNTTAGKIISFQLLWSILTIVGMLISIFLSNLIIGEAGDGLYVMLIVYLLSILFNIFTIAKTAFLLNKEDENILPSIPNLF